MATSQNQQADWPWAAWGLLGASLGIGLFFLLLFPFFAAGGPSFNYVMLLLVSVGFSFLGWLVGIRIGRRRNFGL